MSYVLEFRSQFVWRQRMQCSEVLKTGAIGNMTIDRGLVSASDGDDQPRAAAFLSELR